MNASAGARAYDLSEAIIAKRAGLVFTPARRAAIERSLEQAMMRLGVADPERFAELLGESGAVFDDVMHQLTIGETYFFRERAQFDLLRDTIFPALRGDNPPRQLRIWSAACATGEEAYSLAIAASEAGVNARVLGTDVDRARVLGARRGKYRQWSLRGMTPDAVDRYFTRDGSDYCLRGEIRRGVAFSALNLVEDSYPVPSTGGGIDIIFCRNVLIYFAAGTVELVCRKLIDALAPDGWLLVGASDPPVMNYVECEVVQTPAGLAYRRLAKGRSGHGAGWTPFAGTTSPASGASVAPPLPSSRQPLSPLPPALPATPVLQPPASAPLVVAKMAASPASVTDSPIVDAYRSRDYDRVVELGSTALLARTATLGELALGVRAYGNLGKLDEAERFCTAALDRAPESGELHALHAMLLIRAGHPRPAAVAARRAIYLDRDFTVARVALGDAQARLGESDAALRSYATALRQLEALAPGATVPGSDGESRERYISAVRDRMKPMERAS